MDDSTEKNKNFFKHVFNFDDDSKSEILNIIQYALLSVIPIVTLNKTIKKYVPEADDKKGNVEITAEILIQVIVTFMGLLLIHRMITFIPTYSEEKYPDFHIIYIILGVLMILISLQTKLGEKINILFDRLNEFWNGKPQVPVKKHNVKVSQPITGQQQQQQINSITSQPNYAVGTAISSLPTNEEQYGGENTMQPQQLPNYNEMYRKDNNPLVGAGGPGSGSQEPFAANEALGGGSFGSSW